MKLGLVLGAGGLVGVAHHVGVLRALEREAGFVPGRADLVVGTSAGSPIAAYVRSGWSTEDLWERLAVLAKAAPEGAGAGPLAFVRRLVGSGLVAARALVPLPRRPFVPWFPQVLQRAFPAGMVTMGHGPDLLDADLPPTWPARDLWICAFDLGRGRRVVLGRPGAPQLPLVQAVVASCAIPGVYPPIRVGGKVLVDGGVHSLTNLDLAVAHGCDVVVCVAPMAYGPATEGRRSLGGEAGGLFSGASVVRLWPSATLRAETRAARRRGTELVLLAPGAAEARAHGYNLLRATGLDQVALAAYDATARSPATARLAELLDAAGDGAGAEVDEPDAGAGTAG